MSKKRNKTYIRARIVMSYDDGLVCVECKHKDGRERFFVERKDLLIVTPNSNIVPWSPAKAKKKGSKK